MNIMPRNKTLRAIAAGLIAVAAVAFIFLYSRFDPAESSLFPRCYFLTLTGLKCPGCGSQRAIHAILHGNFAAALRYNALLFAAIPTITLLFAAELHRDRFPKLYNRCCSIGMILTTTAVIILWWILRNIFGF